MSTTTSVRYFSDLGGTVEISAPRPMANAKYRALFGSIKGRRYDGFSMMVGDDSAGRVLPVTRAISYKRSPSLHKCNAKCLGGKPNGICECSCGGKNHGAGMFTSL